MKTIALLALPAIALAQVTLFEETKYPVKEIICGNNGSSQLEWDCCFDMSITESIGGTMCANITVVPEQLVVFADISVNGMTIIHHAFPLVDPTYCEALPFAPFITVCTGLDNINIHFQNHSISACAYVSIEAMGWPLAKYELTCQTIGNLNNNMFTAESAKAIQAQIDQHTVNHPTHVSPIAKLIAYAASTMPAWAQFRNPRHFVNKL